MTYKEQLLKRVQDQLNDYFEHIKTTDENAIENELFIIKSYLYSRSQPHEGEDLNGDQ